MGIAIGALFSFLIVLVSTFTYTLLLWWADRHEKEPVQLLLVALVWGAVPAVAVSLILEVLIGARVRPADALTADLFHNGVVAPVVEEVAKGLVLLMLYHRQRLEFDGPLDGIVYGALVGFGFAMTENLFYFLGALAEGGLGGWLAVVVVRQFFFGLNHAFYTSFTGIGFGLARLRRKGQPARAPLAGLAAAVLFHAVHNITLSLANVRALVFAVTLLMDLAGVVLVLAVLVLAVRREERWIAEELADEVGQTLTEADYAELRTYRGRVQGLMRRHGRERRLQRRIHRLATELALKKHQLRRVGEDQRVRLRIAQLRAQLISAREERGAGHGEG